MNIFSTFTGIVLILLEQIIMFFPFADEVILTQYQTQFNVFKSYIAGASWFFPVATLFTLLGFILTIEGTLFTYRLIKFIAKNLSLGLFKE